MFLNNLTPNLLIGYAFFLAVYLTAVVYKPPDRVEQILEVRPMMFDLFHPYVV